MSVLEISRVDRRDRTYDLAALFPDLEGPFAAADVALLAKGSKPTVATVWTPVTVASGVATVKWAAPDSDSTGAVVVPASCDAWMRVSDGDETRAVKLGRITVLGGGPALVAPNPLYVLLPPGGVDGQVLGLVGGQLAWVTPTGGTGTPLTTAILTESGDTLTTEAGDVLVYV